MVVVSFNVLMFFILVIDFKKMEISVDVVEVDIGSIVVDQEVIFIVDVYLNCQFCGCVVQICNFLKIVQFVVVYVIIIEVDNSDFCLKFGMIVNVFIIMVCCIGIFKVVNFVFCVCVFD